MIQDFPISKILLELEQDNLLPAILFRTARRQCDLDIERVERARAAELSREDSQRIKAEIEDVCQKYALDRAVVEGHLHYSALVKVGVGAHHAGQLLVWRLLLEELMSRGVLRLLIATGTVAAGVDFPARTVVISAHSKRGNDGFAHLTSSEFQQMSGRAGRRGRDTVGFCLVAPGPYSDARVIQQLVGKPPEPLRSAYFAAPATVLNLLKYRNVDDLRYTVGRSLAGFLDRKAAVRMREEATVEGETLARAPDEKTEARKRAEKKVRKKFRDADDLEKRQEAELQSSLDGLERLGHVSNGALTEKGFWAANLCTSLVLELAEAIHAGLFFDLSVEELAALVGAIAGDPHRPYFSLKANPIKKEYFKKLEETVAHVASTYGKVQSDVVVLPDAALTILTWMDSPDWQSFSGLLRLSGVAEGDVSRLVSQTADHLNQLTRLYESHPKLAQDAADARRKILRPPLSEAFLAE